MNKRRRIQLTLFIDEKQSAAIERIRQKFNPQQYGLIKAHVTLCREDEIESFDNVLLTDQPGAAENFYMFWQSHSIFRGQWSPVPVNDNLHSFRTLPEPSITWYH
ncbi:MAG: hypothetical protein IPP25_09600 [Saprospiraceae bacterium]|nr:hypothetical protein [Candidatus Opimibacter skivensis]